MQKFPVDSHSNENFIYHFFRPPGAAKSQKGEDTFGTRVRPHAKFGVNRPACCREIVDKKAKGKVFVLLYVLLYVFFVCSLFCQRFLDNTRADSRQILHAGVLWFRMCLLPFGV